MLVQGNCVFLRSGICLISYSILLKEYGIYSLHRIITLMKMQYNSAKIYFTILGV